MVDTDIKLTVGGLVEAYVALTGKSVSMTVIKEEGQYMFASNPRVRYSNGLMQYYFKIDGEVINQEGMSKHQAINYLKSKIQQCVK